ELWDPDRGIRFATYAAHWIAEGVREALRRRPIAISKWSRMLMSKWKRLARAGVPDDEIPRWLGLSAPHEARLRHAVGMDMPSGCSPLDYRAPSFFAGASAGELALLATEGDDEVHEVLSRLSPEDRELLVLRYGIGAGEPALLHEIARRSGVTRQRVGFVVRRAERRFAELLALRTGKGASDARPVFAGPQGPPEGEAPRRLHHAQE